MCNVQKCQRPQPKVKLERVQRQNAAKRNKKLRPQTTDLCIWERDGLYVEIPVTEDGIGEIFNLKMCSGNRNRFSLCPGLLNFHILSISLIFFYRILLLLFKSLLTLTP